MKYFLLLSISLAYITAPILVTSGLRCYVGTGTYASQPCPDNAIFCQTSSVEALGIKTVVKSCSAGCINLNSQFSSVSCCATNDCNSDSPVTVTKQCYVCDNCPGSSGITDTPKLVSCSYSCATMTAGAFGLQTISKKCMQCSEESTPISSTKCCSTDKCNSSTSVISSSIVLLISFLSALAIKF
ncbi:unnamed protein product [Brachionus calyciflorus]|uniref:Snake toxin/toxin-like domain-containing protein n=1 Tax=Brachionus calyciflorus TaxID=104777 RepID=A0A814EPP6_9BILA|nr:unnamed protein product [Brachionus calyciflorus]